MKTSADKNVSLIKELRLITLDYNASVIAGEIIDHGVSQESICFKNRSIFKRFVSKEIESIYWDRVENEPDQLVFDLNKEGLYDMLPEAVIHAPGTKKKGEEYSDEFKEQRQQEKDARKFFSPIENEFAQRILDFDLIERELFKNNNKVKNRQFFEYFFGKSDMLNDQQLLTLIHVLPLSHKIRSDLKLISLTLSKILNYHVIVTKQFCRQKLICDDISKTPTGIQTLGVDMILSDFIISYSWKYKIQIQEVPIDDFKTFIPSGKNRNIIDFVISFFFPVTSDIEIETLAPASNKDLCISPTNICYLGFNSYI